MNRETLFPKLINELHIKIGVEIGVAGGLHSINILKKSNIEKLYCVDPYPDNLWAAKEKDGTKRYQTALKNLDKWIKEDRAELIREESLIFAENIQNDSIDFVYLDGNREKDYFRKDIEVWLKKLRSGGILAGHDYKTKRGCPVKRIIDEFCESNNIPLNTTNEKCPSWWFYRS